MSDDLTPLAIVYLGKCMLEGGGLGALIAPLDVVKDRVHAARELASPFAVNGSPFSVVGGIYTTLACLNEDDPHHIKRYRPQDASYKRTFEDAEAVLAWEIEDRGVIERHKLKSVEKKAASNTVLTHTIADLRRAYKATGYANRSAFKMWLMSELDK